VNVIEANWQEVPRVGHEGNYYTVEESKAQIAIVSTSGSRHIVAHPNLVGQQYIDQVSAATKEALGSIAWERHGLRSDVRPHPLVLIRGGVTFSPLAAIEALGHAPGPQSFISSESSRPAGTSSVATQRYVKFEGLKGSRALLICDIVATGGTVLAAVEKVLEEAPGIRQLIVAGFVTAEGVERLSEQLQGKMHLLVIAFEGLFRLPDAMPRPLTTPCDFRRSHIVCDPHLLRLVEANPRLAVEQCLVYDGGERAFAPSAHIQGRNNYLASVEALSRAHCWNEVLYRSGFLWDASRILGDRQRALDDLARARSAVARRFDAPSLP
jgi:hypothetical protein